jgi:phosphatidate cytidylyltransferase
VALPAIAFAIFIVAYGGWVFAAGALALGILCLHELFRMYEGLRPVKLAGFAALVGLAVAAEAGDERQVLLAAVAFVRSCSCSRWPCPSARASPSPTGWRSPSSASSGSAWRSRTRSCCAKRCTATGSSSTSSSARSWATRAPTSGAAASGRGAWRPGSRPTRRSRGWSSGSSSPCSRRGCAGLYQDWLSHGQALLLGVAVGLAAPLGDLFESQVKRDAGAKDAGRAFGAHGGALDRLDAAFFTLVAGYYVWLALL